MAIFMFNPEKDGKTMDCHYCHGKFKLLFSCSGCSKPVCFGCGLLEQPGKPHLLELVDNVTRPLDIDEQWEIGLNEWLTNKEDQRERFLCPVCMPEGSIA